MKNLITPQEAEKAIKYIASNAQFISGQQGVKFGYNACAEAANAKFSTDYLPVIKKCREALEIGLEAQRTLINVFSCDSERDSSREEKIKSTLQEIKSILK